MDQPDPKVADGEHCEDLRVTDACLVSVDDAVMPKTKGQTRKEMREPLSRWWARKKVKVARLLGSRAGNERETSQTDSNPRQRGSKFWLLLVGALTLLLTSWWTGVLDEYLWPPEQAVLAIENSLRAEPQRPEDRFRVVLCWLENDKSGDDTQIVAQAFQSVSGIELVRSAHSIRASGAADDWQSTMQEGAAEVLEAWDADLAIFGLVKKSGEVLSLWFVPRTGEGTLGRGDRPYKLEDVTLGEDFHDDLADQLVAVALAAVVPTVDPDEVLGQALEKWLLEARGKLVALLRNSTIDQTDRRVRLQKALGILLLGLSDLDAGTEYLEQAVSVYRAVLEELSRAQAPLEWASIQYYLGTALSILGKREGGAERLEEAVEAHRSVLEELNRERAPLQWASKQNNLGTVLRSLGELEGDPVRLEEAVEAHQSALEEFTRERAPLEWARTQNNLSGALWILGELEGGT